MVTPLGVKMFQCFGVRPGGSALGACLKKAPPCVVRSSVGWFKNYTTPILVSYHARQSRMNQCSQRLERVQ